MPKIWFFGDPHFGHTNCILHDQRPFWRPRDPLKDRVHSGWPEGLAPDIIRHDQAILDLLRSTVQQGDEAWCLGDWVFHGGTPWGLRHSAGWYCEQLLPRTIHMVAGNHDDQGKLTAGHFKRSFASYQDVAYITRKGVKLFLFHYSCRTWRGSNHGSIHLHAHSHGALPPLGRSLDVGLFNNGMKLWELDEVIAATAKAPAIDHHAVENAGAE